MIQTIIVSAKRRTAGSGRILPQGKCVADPAVSGERSDGGRRLPAFALHAACADFFKYFEQIKVFYV